MLYIEDGFDEKPEATPRDLFPYVAFVVNFLLYAAWFGLGYWYGRDAARPVATARGVDYAIPPVVTRNPAYAPPSVGCRFVGDEHYRRMVEAYAQQAAVNEFRVQQNIDPPDAGR